MPTNNISDHQWQQLARQGNVLKISFPRWCMKLLLQDSKSTESTSLRMYVTPCNTVVHNWKYTGSYWEFCATLKIMCVEQRHWSALRHWSLTARLILFYFVSFPKLKHNVTAHLQRHACTSSPKLFSPLGICVCEKALLCTEMAGEAHSGDKRDILHNAYTQHAFWFTELKEKGIFYINIRFNLRHGNM